MSDLPRATALTWSGSTCPDVLFRTFPNDTLVASAHLGRQISCGLCCLFLRPATGGLRDAVPQRLSENKSILRPAHRNPPALLPLTDAVHFSTACRLFATRQTRRANKARPMGSSRRLFLRTTTCAESAGGGWAACITTAGVHRACKGSLWLIVCLHSVVRSQTRGVRSISGLV